MYPLEKVINAGDSVSQLKPQNRFICAKIHKRSEADPRWKSNCFRDHRSLHDVMVVLRLSIRTKSYTEQSSMSIGATAPAVD